jgi:hypothetical protein
LDLQIQCNFIFYFNIFIEYIERKLTLFILVTRTYLPVYPLEPEPGQYIPYDTIWNSILAMYYLNTGSSNDIIDYSSYKIFIFIANIIIVLILFNMIIALMK